MDDFNKIEALDAIEESDCFVQIFQTTYDKDGLKSLNDDNYERNTTIQMVVYHTNKNFAKAMKVFLESLHTGCLSEVEQTINDKTGEYFAKIILLTNDEEE